MTNCMSVFVQHWIVSTYPMLTPVWAGLCACECVRASVCMLHVCVCVCMCCTLYIISYERIQSDCVIYIVWHLVNVFWGKLSFSVQSISGCLSHESEWVIKLTNETRCSWWRWQIWLVSSMPHFKFMGQATYCNQCLWFDRCSLLCVFLSNTCNMTSVCNMLKRHTWLYGDLPSYVYAARGMYYVTSFAAQRYALTDYCIAISVSI